MSGRLIEKIYIEEAGDPSVGIPGSYITIDGVFIDTEDIEGGIERFRQELKHFFADWVTDGAPVVIFDFEVRDES